MTISNYAINRTINASREVSRVIGMIGNERAIPQLVKNELTEIVVRLDCIQDMLLAVAANDRGQLDVLMDEYKDQGFKKTIDHHIETQDKPLPWIKYVKIDAIKQQFPIDEAFLVMDAAGTPWTAIYLDGKWVSDDDERAIKGVTHYMRIDYPITEE